MPRDLPSDLLHWLYLLTEGIPPPTKEFRFHPIRRWRLDLAWPAFLIGIETHGGIWAGGRHVRGYGFRQDREKMSTAAVMGWLILEFTADQIDDDPLGTVTLICAAFNQKGYPLARFR
jgi:very-short-patch-repair endonuclease